MIVGYGLRNPWRFSFDRLKGDLYIGDVGQDSWEELDFTPRRSPGLENYGWRVYEGKTRYSNETPNQRGASRHAVHRHAEPAELLGDRRLRLSRQGRAGCGRPLLLQRQLREPRAERGLGRRDRGARRAVHGRRASSSFGEDARGELYIDLRDDGKVYRLAR